LRLRIENKNAIIREVHVYGQSLRLHQQKTQKAAQHQGLGKLLISKAEEIAKK